jgi:hypothetical protein
MVTTKNSPLWKTNPKQQAKYLALKYWARLYAPAVIMGVYSSDELEPEAKAPTEKVEKVINPTESNSDSEKPDEISLPDYTQEQFNQNSNKWANAIDAGKATPESIVSMISSKYTLSGDLTNQILELTTEKAA